MEILLVIEFNLKLALKVISVLKKMTVSIQCSHFQAPQIFLNLTAIAAYGIEVVKEVFPIFPKRVVFYI